MKNYSNGSRIVVLHKQTNLICLLFFFFFSLPNERYVTHYAERGVQNASTEWPFAFHYSKICCWRKGGKHNYLKRRKTQLNFLSWDHYELKIQPCVTKPHKTYKLLNSLLISFLGSFKNCLSLGLLLCAEIMCPRQKVNCSRYTS